MSQTTHKYEIKSGESVQASVTIQLASDDPSMADGLFTTMMDCAWPPQLGYEIDAGGTLFRLDNVVIRKGQHLEYHFTQSCPRLKRYIEPPSCKHKPMRRRRMDWPDGGGSELCEECLMARHIDMVDTEWQDHGYKTISDWYREAAQFQDVMNRLEGRIESQGSDDRPDVGGQGSSGGEAGQAPREAEEGTS